MTHRPVMDPFVHGLVCAKGHRYFQTLRMPAREQCVIAKKFDPGYPDGLTLEEKVRFWFENPRCRENFFDCAANIARRIYEVTVLGDNAPAPPLHGHCPICAQTLDGSFQTPDGWTLGASCAAGHQFLLAREICAYGLGEPINLKPEPDFLEIKTYAEVYTDKRYARDIHADIRVFMKRYMDGLAR